MRETDEIGFKTVWQERFHDSKEWMDEVFPRINREEQAQMLRFEDSVASIMLLRRFDYLHFDSEMKCGYIYGAATRKKLSGKGLMARLMTQALHESRKRGDALCFLKPAQRWLYGYYSCFGFATTVYIDEQRYVPAHKFHFDKYEFEIEHRVYDIAEFTVAYDRLSASRKSHLIHDEHDFKTILVDNAIEDGLKTVVRRRETHEICAVAIAVVKNGRIIVRDLTAEDENSAQAALSGISAQAQGLRMTVEAEPLRVGVKYEARGMARIINVEKFFESIAAEMPASKIIRVTDGLLDENGGLYEVGRGKVNKYKDVALQKGKTAKIDLDVDVPTLTSILFSSKEMGEVFGLPTCRPYISLVLD